MTSLIIDSSPEGEIEDLCVSLSEDLMLGNKPSHDNYL